MTRERKEWPYEGFGYTIAILICAAATLWIVGIVLLCSEY
jgi:hypothetical protein